MFIHNDVTYSVSNKFQEKKFNTSKDFRVFFVQNICNIEIYKSVEAKFWRLNIVVARLLYTLTSFIFSIAFIDY